VTLGLASAKALVALAALALMPPPDVSGSEWAAEYRVLSAEDSGAPGRWDLDARPYQNEIMDTAADLVHEFVSVVGPAQWGKTAIGLNIVGRIIHIDPAAIMVVHPTISAGQKWSKTRFSPMVRDCPVLTALVSADKSRSKSATILEKTFRGGLLINVGANAPAGLASQPVKYLIFEELDRVPIDVSAGKEGDYEALAIARTTDAFFIRTRKIYRSSSPTILGASRIERAWNESDQRHWHFTCPHCGHEQRLHWENVVFDDSHPEDAFYGCSGAGCVVTDPELRRAVRRGRWIATRPWIHNHAGFWISGLMVREMSYVAAEFIEARKGGIRKIQTWKNTCLGELFNTREGEEAKTEGLLKRARASNYVSGQVPAGVGILTAGIDVQTSNPQRLEIVVRGTGLMGEQWVVKHEVIIGNLALPEPWNRLEEFLLQGWARADGGTMRIKAVGVDTGGHFRREVLQFRKRIRMQSLVLPVKGASKFQRKMTLKAKTKYPLWLIDTVQAKDAIYGNLMVEAVGPRHQHFPSDLDQNFFDQLLSERPIHKAGRRGYETYPKDARNEVLDCHVYADAALEISGPWNLEALVKLAKDNAMKQQRERMKAGEQGARAEQPPVGGQVIETAVVVECVVSTDTPGPAPEPAPTLPPPAPTPPPPARPVTTRPPPRVQRIPRVPRSPYGW